MQTKFVTLDAVHLNEANPRKITPNKLKQLAKSILCLPQMLELRPVVVDSETSMVALGGNMRLKALRLIAEDGFDTSKMYLADLKTFKKMKRKEQDALIEYWQKWFDKPVVPIIPADGLSDEQKKQFIIKDNSAFGTWDYDMLNAVWDKEEVTEWGGVDNWGGVPTGGFGSAPDGGGISPESGTADNAGFEMPQTFEDENGNGGDALPAELQGLDLNPDDLPKIQGSDQTLKERVIIVYDKEQMPRLASMLGLPAIDKVVYSFDEIAGKE